MVNTEERIQEIISKIKEYFKENGFERAVLGLSGGIDSALATYLTVQAIGKENVVVLIMPEEGLTSEENIEHAESFSKDLGITSYFHPINAVLDAYDETEWEQSEEAHINLKPRIRATLLYNFANTRKCLVVGTGNKTELLLGYFTKHGDGAVDLLPLGDIYKTEVYDMARFLELPDYLIGKPPTAELVEGQTDEDDLGGVYEEMDQILKLWLEENLEIEQIVSKGFEEKLVTKIIGRVEKNKHKTNPIPIIRLDV